MDNESEDLAAWGLIGLRIVVAMFGVAVQAISWFWMGSATADIPIRRRIHMPRSDFKSHIGIRIKFVMPLALLPG